MRNVQQTFQLRIVYEGSAYIHKDLYVPYYFELLFFISHF
jgi:hypothetical protein